MPHARRLSALVAVAALVAGVLAAGPAYAATATSVSGWSTSAVTMKVGGELSASAKVSPAAVRTVLLQARKGTTGSVTTRATLTTSSSGAVTARFTPTSTGTWYVRLSVKATATYAARTTAWRKVTVSGTAGTTTVTTPTVSPSTVLKPAKQTISATVKPAGARSVEVWAKAPGSSTFTLRGRTTSSSSGLAKLTWSAPTPGTWTYRVYVRPTLSLKGVTSATRTATVTDLPGPVTNLVATPGPDQISLSWTNPTAYLAKVVVRRVTEPATALTSPTQGTAVPLASDTATSVTVTGLPFNGGFPSQYTFYVFALDSAGRSGPPVAVSSYPFDTLPGPVSGVSVDTSSTSVTLTWTNPVEHFGEVRVRRTLVSEPAPASAFDGTEVPLSSTTATTVVDSGLVAGTAYRWTFFTISPYGNAGQVLSVEATTLAALTWGSSTTVYHVRGGLKAVECPAGPVVFCVAADQFGNVLELSGGTWSEPAQVPGITQAILALSCPTQNVCYGSTIGGDIVVRSGLGVWSKQANVSTTGIGALSCAPGQTFCVAVDFGGKVRFTTDGVTWIGTTSLPGSASGAAADCWATAACVVSSFSGKSFTLTEVSEAAGGSATFTTNTVPTGASGSTVASVDCPAPGSCVYVTSDGLAWKTGDSATTTVDAGRQLTDVSCGSTTFCVAVDYNGGRRSTFNGTTWSAPSATDPRPQWQSVSCSSATFCVAVDASSFGWESRYDGTTWGQVNPIDVYSSSWRLSCTSTSFCMMADLAGRWSSYDGSTWTTPAQLDPDQYSIGALDCFSPTLCVAATNIGTVYRWNGTAWSLESNALGGQVTRGVSCPSATFCVVVASNGIAIRWNGSSWTSPETVGTGATLYDVSCASASYCLAVAEGSTSFVLSDGVWGGPVATPAQVYGVECPSSTFCMALDFPGNWHTWDGTSWTAHPAVTASAPAAAILSCTSATSCTAVGQGFVLRSSTWDGGSTWVDSQPLDLGALSPAGTVSDLSCVSASWCMALDGVGRVHLGTR